MIRRLFWALLGLAFGAVLGAAAVRWAQRTKERLSPPNLAREAGSKMEDAAKRFREAVEEGRHEMELREAELRVRLGLE